MKIACLCLLSFLLWKESVPAATNHVFRGHQTYLITGKVSLYGTTVLEAGTIIKFTRHPLAQIELNGPLECRTAPWEPAVFTAMDDDSVGEPVPGSSGKPEGSYGLYALAFRDTNAEYRIHNLHIRHARYGVAFYHGTHGTIQHAQVRDTLRGVAWQAENQIHLQNVLFERLNHAFWGLAPAISVAHATFHDIGALHRFPVFPIAMTNTILSNVDNPDGAAGVAVSTSLHPESTFVDGGKSGLYLHPDSPFRLAGITNIHPSLRQALDQRTTDAPIVLEGMLEGIPHLQPSSRWNHNPPDLGYYHDRLDFILRDATLSGQTLMATNGVTVGFRILAGRPALTLTNGAMFFSQGSPQRSNRFIHVHPMEGKSEGADPHTPLLRAERGAAYRFQFTRITSLNPNVPWNGMAAMGTGGAWTFRNCEMKRGRWTWPDAGEPTAVNALNNIWQATHLELEAGLTSTFEFRNNLFRDGRILLAGMLGHIILSDNLLVRGELEAAPLVRVTHGHNGFANAAVSGLVLSGTDRMIPAPGRWKEGALGDHYYSLADPAWRVLLDAGSRSASLSGLYHYTTTQPETPEGFSPVDIGVHYLASAAEGSRDRDNDGWPDHEEDANGNGQWDPGESDFNRFDTDQDGMDDLTEHRQGRSPVSPDAVFAGETAFAFGVLTMLEETH